MVAPSKLFQHPINCYHCSQSILHPGIGCFRYYLNNLFEHSISGLKYFSPLLITPLVMKYKMMNKELFVNTMKYYLQTVCWASVATSTSFFMVCCLRNILGRFRTYTTLFIPTVLGLQFCWLFPVRVMKLFTLATSQAALEALLRQYSNRFTYLILHSSMVQTILFMLNSAIILNYKRKNIYKDYWFIKPYEKIDEAKREQTLGNDETNGFEDHHKKCNTKCGHTNISCSKFVLNGIKSYIIFGIPLDLLAMIIRGKVSKNSQGILQKTIEKFKSFRPNMTGFFISYVGIYRLSSCLLRKYYSQLSFELQHILSAFLGGFSYLCVNRVSFISMSSVISTQLLWQQFCNYKCSKTTTKLNRKQNLVLLLLKNAPFSQIILSVNVGYLAHNYVLNYHLVNSLARGFMDALTCNKIKNIRNFLLNNDQQTIINLVKTNSIKTFL